MLAASLLFAASAFAQVAPLSPGDVPTLDAAVPSPASAEEGGAGGWSVALPDDVSSLDGFRSLSAAPIGPSDPQAGRDTHEIRSANFEHVPEVPSQLWATLERKLLTALGRTFVPKTDDWRGDTARRLRNEPSLPLEDALATSLVSVHRLSQGDGEKVHGLLAATKPGAGRGVTVPGPAPRRLFVAGGRLYGAVGYGLKRLSGDGWDDLMGLPNVEVADVQSHDGRLFAAGDEGVFVQEAEGRWSRVGRFAANALAFQNGELLAAGDKGLWRKAGNAWVREDAVGIGAVYHVAQLGDRWYASTSEGLFEGEVAARPVERKLTALSLGGGLGARLRCAVFGAPTVRVAAGRIDWNPEPIFRRVEQREESVGYDGTRTVDYTVRVYQAESIDGELRIATEAGVFKKNPDGTWKQEVSGKAANRLRPMSAGAWAIGPNYAYVRGPRGWKERTFSFGDALRDAAELDGVAYLAWADLATMAIRLPDDWAGELLSGLPEPEPPKASPSSAPAAPETGAIRNKSGRPLFGGGGPDSGPGLGAAPEQAPLEAPEPWTSLERAALRAEAPSRATDWIAETESRLRSRPELPLPEAMAATLASLHRLDADGAARVRRILEGLPMDDPASVTVRRFFELDGRFHGAVDEGLVEIRSTRNWPLSTSIWSPADAVEHDGRTYLGTPRGLYLLEHGHASPAPGGRGLVVRSLRRTGGALFALAGSDAPGVFRVDPDGVRPLAVPAELGRWLSLDEAGGRLFASTTEGVYEVHVITEKERRDVDIRTPWPWPLSLLLPARVEKSHVWEDGRTFSWRPEPFFRASDEVVETLGYGVTREVRRTVRPFQVFEAGGELRVAAENGIYVRRPAGWVRELDAQGVHRVRSLAGGVIALGAEGAWRLGKGGWSAIASGRTFYDAAQKGDLLYLAARDELSARVLLPEGWRDEALRQLEKRRTPGGGAQGGSGGPGSDGGRLLNRSGRPLFESGLPAAPEEAPSYPELRRASLAAAPALDFTPKAVDGARRSLGRPSGVGPAIRRAQEAWAAYRANHRRASISGAPAVAEPEPFFRRMFGMGQLLGTSTSIGPKISVGRTVSAGRSLMRRFFSSAPGAAEAFERFLERARGLDGASPNRLRKRVQRALFEASLYPAAGVAAYLDGLLSEAYRERVRRFRDKRQRVLLFSFLAAAKELIVLQEHGYPGPDRYNIAGVLVTGSLVYGAALPESDLDFFVLTWDGTSRHVDRFLRELEPLRAKHGWPDWPDKKRYPHGVAVDGKYAARLATEFESVVTSPHPDVEARYKAIELTRPFYKTSWCQEVRSRLLEPLHRLWLWLIL